MARKTREDSFSVLRVLVPKIILVPQDQRTSTSLLVGHRHPGFESPCISTAGARTTNFLVQRDQQTGTERERVIFSSESTH
ncbi:hypothetical protein TNCT_148241 [Trichonephila clavata]|uniref:Uncharacterized protein n=1 Tax=Trichonephila clavata TaxID=2740835 RepID=A0A8X6FJD1_TRICU|nr:hypothetical protein TNCT_148241 [Trichonephila clavata]